MLVFLSILHEQRFAMQQQREAELASESAGEILAQSERDQQHRELLQKLIARIRMRDVFCLLLVVLCVFAELCLLKICLV